MRNPRFRQRLKRVGERDWVTFHRCFLMTMGLLLSSIPVVVLIAQGNRRAEWPGWAWLLLLGIGAWGLAVGGVGLFGNKKTTERWTRHMDSPAHVEVSFLVAVIATPLFLLLKLFGRR